uniref:Uncharacterized protein n=1 Tax=Hemiselmis andersenii TaxID=464988 RepID=A0A6T8NHV2_HEMAN|mmetsp:Transcript_22162/g.51457  ORF Transcript_22162/g.51457 Transcript_22162/m.51457 type:complete len:225 (-) Transcript_22162:88-762(-)|eukprot:CAMPEP_0172011860 /NCGR_PEP_ID=MMETSP1041-20130122/8518_1 /TAXON_ID=464988 /ORGANISM="Hemiselmis andersenii, Strain CCMP439" /LENGTH=224 /DNA_ID=CAMNT_0012666375 /DNA_START=83 /DNA_END=757 /DNA_ORIENTATION=+
MEKREAGHLWHTKEGEECEAPESDGRDGVANQGPQANVFSGATTSLPGLSTCVEHLSLDWDAPSCRSSGALSQAHTPAATGSVKGAGHTIPASSCTSRTQPDRTLFTLGDLDVPPGEDEWGVADQAERGLPDVDSSTHGAVDKAVDKADPQFDPTCPERKRANISWGMLLELEREQLEERDWLEIERQVGRHMTRSCKTLEAWRSSLNDADDWEEVAELGTLVK